MRPVSAREGSGLVAAESFRPRLEARWAVGEHRSRLRHLVTSPLMAGEYVRPAFDYDEVVSPAEESGREGLINKWL